MELHHHIGWLSAHTDRSESAQFSPVKLNTTVEDEPQSPFALQMNKINTTSINQNFNFMSQNESPLIKLVKDP